ncbi:TonB-dependent siderophore receptor [Oleiharenicola sp. Vm1]|uniref:TonB-dependent siderophore receptor n=1 Tax=Oleiharenicola sp. Vm1 TaxID=3398393 RepID=UPI0039F50F9B
MASSALGLWLPSASAQATDPAAKPADTAPASADAKNNDAPLVLSPFTVTTEKDNGYKATNATSGTRLNTPIKELPMPISVITEKFLRDTGSSDLRQSLRYTAGILLQSQNDQGTPGGAYQGPGGVNNPEGATANKTATSYKIRGYVTDAVLRDGYRRQNSTDSINISRVEVVFGPAALLYGFGEFGGIVNYIPKAPDAKAATEIGLTYGTENFKRATLDTTGPLGTVGNLRYRLTGAWEDTDSWTDFNTQSHTFFSPSISFNPTKTTQVDIDYENGDMKQKGVGFQRVRAMANVGINSDQNEHADFYTVPGTDKKTFRWSGNDTYVNTQATNFRAQIAQKLFDNLNLLVGYNRSTADFQTRDVYGNLAQNVGPAALRKRVFFTTLNPTAGDSNLNAVNGYVDDVVLQYTWGFSDTKTTRDQVRAEATYKFDLFPDANKWLRTTHSFLLGHSEETAENDVSTGGTLDNQFNFKSPTDASYITWGKQGDGSADVATRWKNNNYSSGWDQATYLVYQGKLLDNRLTIISGVREDRTDNYSVSNDLQANTSSKVRSAKVKERTHQNGVSLALDPNRHINVFALKAGGLMPNFSGHRDVNGAPVGPVLAKSKEYGVKIDLFDGRLSGSISSYKIKRTGTELFYWWAPTSNYKHFNPNKDIVYNVSNFSPSSVPGGSNGGNGAADSALTQWNAGVAAGAIYQKNNTWYVNASKATGAAYLDAVFDYTKSHGMSWPGWLYNYDDETNNSWNDRASSPDGNEYVIGADSAKGWSAEIMWTPTNNFQVVATYAHTERVIDNAGQFAKSPAPQDRWAVWYFPNTDWGLTGKPLATVYTNAQDTSTWTGIGYGTGEKQDDTPEHAVSVWANYQITKGTLKGFSAGLGGSWESPREYQSGITHGGGQRVTDKNGNLVILKTPDRYNVDLMLRYAFKLDNHDAAVQLNVYNLLDDQKLYGLIYAQPRSAKVEFTYKF